MLNCNWKHYEIEKLKNAQLHERIMCDFFLWNFFINEKSFKIFDFVALWSNFRMRFLIMDHSAKDDIFLIYVGTFFE